MRLLTIRDPNREHVMSTPVLRIFFTSKNTIARAIQIHPASPKCVINVMTGVRTAFLTCSWIHNKIFPSNCNKTSILCITPFFYVFTYILCFYCCPVNTLLSRSASGTIAFFASASVFVCAPTSIRSVFGQ